MKLSTITRSSEGEGDHKKYHKKITMGRGEVTKRSWRITITREGWHKEIITPRISYQWVVEEVKSSWTNIDISRIALTKMYIIWKVG